MEIARRAIAQRNERLFVDPALHSPDLLYRPMATFSESGECRGVDELQRFFESFFEPWADDFIADITSVRDYGDAVSLRIEFSGHARASGIAVSDVVFEVLWLRDGVITRIEDFASSAEALRAVRLEE